MLSVVLTAPAKGAVPTNRSSRPLFPQLFEAHFGQVFRRHRDPELAVRVEGEEPRLGIFTKELWRWYLGCGWSAAKYIKEGITGLRGRDAVRAERSDAGMLPLSEKSCGGRISPAPGKQQADPAAHRPGEQPG